jgi:heme A synthase
MCNGQLIPRAPRIETLVELSHRMSSGAALVLTAALLVWAVREFPPGHLARRGAAVATALMAGEALIGAGLVLFSMVAKDESAKRAVSIGLHLVNTFFLLAATALTAWWTSGGAPPRLRDRPALTALLGVPLAAMVLVGATGALTALGDTLFPAPSLAQGLARDFAPGSHFLVRLRVLHPLVAVGAAAATVVSASLARNLRPTAAVRILTRGVVTLVVMQVGTGLLDMILAAPVTMQLLHVMLADGVWIMLVLTTAAALASDDVTAERPPLLRPAPRLWPGRRGRREPRVGSADGE